MPRSSLRTVLLPFAAATISSVAAAQQFLARTPPPIAASALTAMALADFGLDGDLDVLGVGNLPLGGSNHRLLQNVASERFLDVTASHLPPLAPALHPIQDAVAFDVEGDGDLDVCFGLQFDNWLWQNDGTGRFTAVSQQLPPVTYGFRRVIAADLDGDGDQDLAGIASTLGASISIFVNQGNGTFVAGVGWPTFTAAALDLRAGDLDADGDLDVIGAGAAGLVVWQNQGGLGFVDVTATWTAGLTFAPASSLDVADLDGDGDLDVVLGGNGIADQVLLQSNGAFTSGSVLPAVLAARRLMLVDVDADGDLDRVRGQDSGCEIAINDGAGGLTIDALRVGAVGSSAGLAVGDIDSDGDIDLVVGGGFGPTELLVNRQRDLHAGPPQIAQNWSIEVASEPGYAALTHHCYLGIALQQLPQPLSFGVLGLLSLDLGGPHVVLPAAIPAASGATTFVLQVPNDPLLIGVPLHLQALVDPRWTWPRLTAHLATAFE